MRVNGRAGGFPFSRRKLKDLIRERRLNGFDRCLLQPKGTRLWVLDAEAFVRWMSEQRGGQVRRRKPRKTAA